MKKWGKDQKHQVHENLSFDDIFQSKEEYRDCQCLSYTIQHIEVECKHKYEDTENLQTTVESVYSKSTEVEYYSSNGEYHKHRLGVRPQE